MFLLSIDRPDYHALFDDTIRRENLNALSVDGYRLLWRDNDSIRIERTKHQLCIQMSDRAGQAHKECLRLDFVSRLVSAQRPWPGSRSIYFRSENGLLITTHLRLAVGYGAGHERAPRLMNAGDTITFERGGRRHKSMSRRTRLP
jgi:hypothetical protein